MATSWTGLLGLERADSLGGNLCATTRYILHEAVICYMTQEIISAGLGLRVPSNFDEDIRQYRSLDHFYMIHTMTYRTFKSFVQECNLASIVPLP
jgi:hypothetical protein